MAASPRGSKATSPVSPAYGAAIRDQLQRTFGDDQPHTAVEPGRSIVADAGVLHTTVVAVCWRGGRRWVYLDAGVFSGLVETLDEAIRYRSPPTTTGCPTGRSCSRVRPATAPTCCTRSARCGCPLALKEGDRVRLHAAGAYTSCYSTVGFNGFASLPTHLPHPVPGQR